MAFVFTGAGALGLLAALSAVVLGGLVFWSRSSLRQNRRLALLLTVEGASLSGGLGWMYLTDVPANVWAWQASTVAAGLAIPFAYLLFLATLETPLVRPLRHPVVDTVLKAGLIIAPLGWFLDPIFFVEGVIPGIYTPWDVAYGPGFLLMISAHVAASVVGLVASISAWRRTEPGTARRSQARSYALAFGTRDAGFVLNFPLLALASAGVGGTALGFASGVVLPGAILFLFVALLAYGILKTQLFDIDLKIKWTLEKSTVAAIFVAVFFVVSESAQVLFADFAGDELLGVLAAGALVFVLAPLQRVGQRVGEATMPGVEDTEAYREQRKREVYRASVEELMADEDITAKERRMLGRLQEELGLGGGEAGRIEADVVEGRGAT